MWSANDHPALTKQAFTSRITYWHNLPYDALSCNKTNLVDIESMFAVGVDTGILCRLIDPRTREVGGQGHELKQLAHHYLGLDVQDSRKLVEEQGRKEYGLKKDEVWANIPIDDEVYVKYAGCDTILGARVARYLRDAIKTVGLDDIATFEHRLAYMLATIQRRGWLVDREYALAAKAKFDQDFHRAEGELSMFGITPVAGSGNYYSSKKSITDKFTELGVTFIEFTDKSGAPKLDESVLSKIAAKGDQAALLAKSVLAATKANKMSNTFLAGILHYSEEDGRLHGGINAMGARTGRMSSSRPNLQNFPRDVIELRASLTAEPEHVMISIDYSAAEWRVAAVVTRDERMQSDFASGQDIHWNVAREVYGPNATAANRQTAKIVGLGRLYGGGIDTLVRQTGAPRDTVVRAVEAIDELYPGIRALSRKFYDIINGPTVIKTVTGRRVVADSAHLALNYSVQGPSRDIMAEAIVRVFDAGYGEMIRAVIHDSIEMSVPAERAQEIAEAIRGIMEVDFRGVRMKADASVFGNRWQK